MTTVTVIIAVGAIVGGVAWTRGATPVTTNRAKATMSPMAYPLRGGAGDMIPIP